MRAAEHCGGWGGGGIPCRRKSASPDSGATEPAILTMSEQIMQGQQKLLMGNRGRLLSFRGRGVCDQGGSNPIVEKLRKNEKKNCELPFMAQHPPPPAGCVCTGAHRLSGSGAWATGAVALHTVPCLVISAQPASSWHPEGSVQRVGGGVVPGARTRFRHNLMFGLGRTERSVRSRRTRLGLRARDGERPLTLPVLSVSTARTPHQASALPVPELTK